MKLSPKARNRFDAIGICMLALGWLIILSQLADYWRFGDVDEWVYEFLDFGSPTSLCALTYSVITLLALYLGDD